MDLTARAAERQRLENLHQAKLRILNDNGTADDLKLLANEEARLLEDFGWKFVERCPKRVLVKGVGVAGTALNRHGDQYGFTAIRGEVVNLLEIIKQYYGFIRDNAYSLSRRGEREVVDESGSKSNDWQNLTYREKFIKMRDEREIRHKKLAHLETVVEVHQEWSNRLRAAGEELGKRFGEDARDLLNDALEDCETHLTSLINQEDDLTAD